MNNDYSSSSKVISSSSSSFSSSKAASSSSATDDTAAAEEAAASFLDELQNMPQSEKDSFAAGMASGFEESADMTMADIGLTKEEFANWTLDGMEYTIVDTSVSGVSAQVKATVTSHDAATLMNTFEDELTNFIASPDLSSLTEDQLYSKVGELLKSAMDKTPMTSKTVYLELTRAGGVWTVDRDSQQDAMETIYAYGM